MKFEQYGIRCFNREQLDKALEQISAAPEIRNIFVNYVADSGDIDGYIYVFCDEPSEPRCDPSNLMENSLDEKTLMNCFTVIPHIADWSETRWSDKEEKDVSEKVINVWYRIFPGRLKN